MCKEEIDDLIPSANFQNFRAKSNRSKYLTLKAQYRNCSSEKLKNVPSAQYSSILDWHGSISKDLSENTMPLYSKSSSFLMEPTSDISSDLSISSGSLKKEIHISNSYPSLINAGVNSKFHDDSYLKSKNSPVLEDSKNRTVLKELNSTAPLKYAIITHEFYVKVKNLENFEDCLVNYVFPEGTADEFGSVTSKWTVASIITNISRPFFISLPYGLSLKKFLNKSGKKSVNFYFKHPHSKKTVAKAVLNFADIYEFEEAFKVLSHKSVITKTFTLPLLERNDGCTSESAEVCVEYCNRICKYANIQDVPISSSANLNDFCSNDYLKINTFIQRTNGNESEHLERKRADRDTVAAHILNTTFCVNENESNCEVGQQKSTDNGKYGVKSVDDPLSLKGSGDFTDIVFSNKDHLSTILECSESSRNLSKENRSTSNIIDSFSKTQDVFYPNKEFIMDELQNFSSLKLIETNDAPKEPQEINVAASNNLSSHSPSTVTSSGSNLMNSGPFSPKSVQNLVCSPITKLTYDDSIVTSRSEVAPNQVCSKEVKSEHTNDMHKLGPDYPNKNEDKVQKSFVVPNTSPALSNEMIFNNNVDESSSAKPHQFEFACYDNVDTGSSGSGSKAEDKVFNDYASRCDFFKVDPVPPDRENDAIPKNFSPVHSRKEEQNLSDGNVFSVNRNPNNTCLTKSHLNVSISDDSSETLSQRTPRRNSDSGYVGVSARDSLEQDIRDSSKTHFSSEPIIRKQATAIPQVDDFGISLKNKLQDKCFLARIGIVRSFNIPMIKLKGTKELTHPSTYVTFKDCFKHSHCSSTIVESLTPEYDSRHKAWLSTELLKDPEERLVFQVWCKRYQKEWAGPDCERDRCLGYVACDLSVLIHNFRYAGGWHEIISPSGKPNGHIQILVKPLQNIDFVKNLECEEIICDQVKFMRDLQPYNYYLSSINNTQNDGVSPKQRLSQSITDLEEAIKELQISHENRLTKSQEWSVNKNTPEDKSAKSESLDSNSRDSYNERINQSPWVSKEDPRQKSTLAGSGSKSTARKIANCFLSLRRKSKKPKKLPVSKDDSQSLTSDSVTELENNIPPKQETSQTSGVPATIIDQDNQLPKIEIPKNDMKSVKKSPSFFTRGFSFQSRKSKNKKMIHQNVLLQTLPLYELNVEKKIEDSENCENNCNPNSDFHLRQSSTEYHSL